MDLLSDGGYCMNILGNKIEVHESFARDLPERVKARVHFDGKIYYGTGETESEAVWMLLNELVATGKDGFVRKSIERIHGNK